MSKGIIVLDKPENCMECPFRVNKVEIKCGASHGRYTNGKDDAPEWCPIKPLPDRKIELNYPDHYRLTTKQVIEKVAHNSYNRCLDDILGGAE